MKYCRESESSDQSHSKLILFECIFHASQSPFVTHLMSAFIEIRRFDVVQISLSLNGNIQIYWNQSISKENKTNFVKIQTIR